MSDPSWVVTVADQREGQVVRWYSDFDVADAGTNPIAVVSATAVTIRATIPHPFGVDALHELVTAAGHAQELLRDGRDVHHLATHERDDFDGHLIPIPPVPVLTSTPTEGHA